MTANMKALSQQYTILQKNKSVKISFPDMKNPSIWHVSFKGPCDSAFEQGIYHCKLDLRDYPEKAPIITMMTPNGSFIPNKSICIAGVTSYHPESWTPGTTIESIINTLQMYMQNKNDRHGVGFMELVEGDIRKLKEQSKCWKCLECQQDHSKIQQ